MISHPKEIIRGSLKVIGRAGNRQGIGRKIHITQNSTARDFHQCRQIVSEQDYISDFFLHNIRDPNRILQWNHHSKQHGGGSSESDDDDDDTL